MSTTVLWQSHSSFHSVCKKFNSVILINLLRHIVLIALWCFVLSSWLNQFTWFVIGNLKYNSSHNKWHKMSITNKLWLTQTHASRRQNLIRMKWDPNKYNFQLHTKLLRFHTCAQTKHLPVSSRWNHEHCPLKRSFRSFFSPFRTTSCRRTESEFNHRKLRGTV
jgi:hypothetical protein